MNDQVEELANPVVQMVRDALYDNDDAKVVAIVDLLSFGALRVVMDKLTVEDRFLVTTIIGKQ